MSLFVGRISLLILNQAVLKCLYSFVFLGLYYFLCGGFVVADIKRICKNCGDVFIISHGEYCFFKERNLNLPMKCKTCREESRYFGGHIKQIMSCDTAPPADFNTINHAVSYSWYDKVADRIENSSSDCEDFEYKQDEIVTEDSRRVERYFISFKPTPESVRNNKEVSVSSGRSLTLDQSSAGYSTSNSADLSRHGSSGKTCSICWVRIAGGCDGKSEICEDFFEFRQN